MRARLPIWRKLSLRFRLSLDRGIKQPRPRRSRERGSLSIPGCHSPSRAAGEGRGEAGPPGPRQPQAGPLAPPLPAAGRRCQHGPAARPQRSGGCGGAGPERGRCPPQTLLARGPSRCSCGGKGRTGGGQPPAEGPGKAVTAAPGTPAVLHCTEMKFSKTPKQAFSLFFFCAPLPGKKERKKLDCKSAFNSELLPG